MTTKPPAQRIAAALVLAPLTMGMLQACVSTDTTAISSESAGSSDELSDGLSRMLSGRSMVEGEALSAKIEEASAFPLGSQKNPVRAHMPQGQRAYLSRLRCADLSRPAFERQGSYGIGAYGNIIDAYLVECEGSTPQSTQVFLDMYHPGYREQEAVPGFGIVGGKTAE